MAKEGKLKGTQQKKVFVLDTSVILYDHNAFQNFEEHDVVIPVQVLEELDNKKTGNDTRNFEARSFLRLIDELAKDNLLSQWTLLGKGKGAFRVIMDNKAETDAEVIFGSGKTDHRILNAALSLQHEHPDKRVTLVSKDICLRLKAKSLNINAEDYETGKIKNLDELYTGITQIEKSTEKFIASLQKQQRLSNETLGDPAAYTKNHFYIFSSKKSTASGFYNASTETLELVNENPVFNIAPRNTEQALAIHALMHPDIKLVTIQGNAGTGKTLLALASALEQRRYYRQIYVTRPIVPLSNKDIGFLPGDIKSKIDPYMAPIWDNLKYIKDQFSADEKMQAKIDELVANDKISITPLAFIRGRTLSKIFFIVDEAQNLTPHEVKTIISRAGEDSKFVFTGDIYQIDTPYLDAESNGLSYLIDRAKSHPLYAHITLQKGERSELANLATELL